MGLKQKLGGEIMRGSKSRSVLTQVIIIIVKRGRKDEQRTTRSIDYTRTDFEIL